MKKNFLIALIAMAAATQAFAQTQVVYNSIPKTLPGNVASEGPEAYAFAELGDGLGLTATTGTISQVSVVMSSWPCQIGNWYQGGCVTTPGATFSQPITINLYSVSGVTPTTGALLGSVTQSFDIPYRPTSTPSQCGGDKQVWYSSKEKTCYHGLAVPINVNFSDQHIPVPSDGKLIVAVAFNSTDYGPYPIGPTACNLTTAGCPYDSLNIGTDGNGPTGLVEGVGTVLDANSIFVNYTLSGNACPGNTTTGVLALDPGCWTGFHPLIQVKANTNANHVAKGNKP